MVFCASIAVAFTGVATKKVDEVFSVNFEAANYLTAAGIPLHNYEVRPKIRAGGFRNVEKFKTAIYFHCGGLSLQP